MAAIDKIYGTRKQWQRLYNFLKRKKPKYKKFMYPRPPRQALERPLTNFGYEEDLWLMKNCRLDFVLKRLEEQYGKEFISKITENKK